MSTEVRAALLAGAAQVVAALIALFGVLATGGKAGEPKPPATTAPASGAATAPVSGAATAPAGGAATVPVGGAACGKVVEEYRRLVLVDATMLAALVTPGPDGVSPVEADPDARRCGVSENTLRGLR